MTVLLEAPASKAFPVSHFVPPNEASRATVPRTRYVCWRRTGCCSSSELLTIKQIAGARGAATSTVHRWLNDGIIAGEQLTPGAPWRIRLTDDLRARVAEEAPLDLTVYQTMRLLGVSRQTVWQRVKRGEIKAVRVRRGRKKGLRLKVIQAQPTLFEQTS